MEDFAVSRVNNRLQMLTMTPAKPDVECGRRLGLCCFSFASSQNLARQTHSSLLTAGR